MLTRLQVRFAAWRARRRAKNEAAGIRSERMDEGIGAEAPIRTLVQDRLRRTNFAGRIATVLSELNPREGRVFAIRGGWGFGKSSLKNLIAEQLDTRDDGADWLDFNPWQWGDGDAIARALFGQMANRLGGEHSRRELARADALRRYGAMLTGASAPLNDYARKNPLIATWLTNAAVVAIATAVGFQLPSATKVAACLAVAAIVVPLIGRVLTLFGPDRTKDSLDTIREALEQRLRDLDRPLVVFVDDIDRLEPKQIRMLLRQVKANANLPNIVFVLLFQPSIVERALDRVADGDGRAFLEKIVQANFDLPVVPAVTVHQLFAEELHELVGPYATEENGFSDRRWGNVFVGCIQPMLRNLRDARRLISSIAAHLPLHLASDVLEVNIIDFVLLETLRVFEPDLHQALFRERELLLQERRSGRDRRETDLAAAGRLLAFAAEERRDIARDALQELFPQLEWAYGGMEYADDYQAGWISEKRACTRRYFARYFELQTENGELSESRFVAFLDATATVEGFTTAIADIEADSLLPSLLARLDESVDQLPAENAAVLLPGIFALAERFVGRDEGTPFNSSWVSAWRVANGFLRRIPSEERGNMARDAFRRTEALSVTAILIGLSDPVTPRGRNPATFNPVLDAATVQTMKDEWIQLMKSRAADVEALVAKPDLVSLLYKWMHFTGSLDEPRAWVTGAIRSDKVFATMATRMMRRVSSYSSGDRVSVSHNEFNRETIDDFFSLDALTARLNAIDPTEFPEHEAALRMLRSNLEEWAEQARVASADQQVEETQ